MRFLAVLCALIIGSALGQSTQPTTVPADASVVLDRIEQWCKSGKPFTLTGTIKFDIDAGGMTENHTADFTSMFATNQRFRHEVKGEVLIVATGEKVYAYLPGEKQYVSVDLPKDPAAEVALGTMITELLRNQNPVLLAMLSDDPIKSLTDGAQGMKREPDEKTVAGIIQTIRFTRDATEYRISTDAVRGCVTAVQTDLRQRLKSQGVENVKTANLVISYSPPDETAKIDATTFNWTPPKDAKLAAADEGVTVAGTGADPAEVLTGKPAPDFELPDLDGKPVTLAALKGNVVVLDFWATWCGPCVQSMPHLEQLYVEMNGKGLRMYAINLRESEQIAKTFVEKNKLSLPVLLDASGSVAKKYAVSGIPQTVVIGKDGLVKKVIVGFGGDDSELCAAVEEAMK